MQHIQLQLTTEHTFLEELTVITEKQCVTMASVNPNLSFCCWTGRYSVVHLIRIRLIRIFAYLKKPLGPTIETIQKIRMENTVKSKVENPIYVIVRAQFIPWEQLSLFVSRDFTLQFSVSSLFRYSTRQDLDYAYAELFFTVGMASKQKYKSLSVKQKLEILERLDHLPAHKKKDIAAEFEIPCSTLSTILKNKETLKRQHALGSSKKFRLKESTKPDVDAALFQ